MGEHQPRRRPADPDRAKTARTRTDGVIEFAPEVIRASVNPQPADVIRRSAALGGNAAALRTAHALGFAGGDLNADAYTGEEPPDFFFGALADLNTPIPPAPEQESPPSARASISLTISGAAAPRTTATTGLAAGQHKSDADTSAEPATATTGSEPDTTAASVAEPKITAPGDAKRPAGAPGTVRAKGISSAGTDTSAAAPPATAAGPAAVNSPGDLVTAVSIAAGSLGTAHRTTAQPPDIAAGRAFPSALAAPLAAPGAALQGV